MSKKKIYQKNKDGSKFRDDKGWTRYTRDGGKHVYGDSTRLLVGTKKFSK